MKGIYSGTRNQFNDCKLIGNCEYDSPAPSPPAKIGNGGRGRHVHTLATSAYDTLEQPFRSDQQRGHWAKSVDFYFICTSHTLGSMAFSVLPFYSLSLGGWLFLIIPYLLAIGLYAFPIFIIQSFLGQFSSSGTISAFRISPIFKGIGYSILLLNLCTLTYFSISAAVPLVYAVNSLHYIIPWMSCDNAWNTPNCSTHDQYDEEAEIPPHSTVEFFRAMVRSTAEDSNAFSISWSVLIGAMAAWLITLGLLLKNISFIGKVVRCVSVLMFGFFLAIFAYLLIHEDFTWHSLGEYSNPTLEDSWEAINQAVRIAILMACSMLGPGWGSVLTLASYNRFRSDCESIALWGSLTHVLLFVMSLICSIMAADNFELHVSLHADISMVDEHHNMHFLYICFGYLFGRVTPLPNLWAFLFFSMVFLAELCALVIQMLSVLTALFDEFEMLRSKKKYVTTGLVICLMATSVYFCTQQGFNHMNLLPNVALFSHIVISVLMLVIVTWIYGRSRFQCDLQFMLGKTISTWKIFIIRFATPIFSVVCLLQIWYYVGLDNLSQALHWISQCAAYLITLGYIVHKVCQTSGTWRQRLRQCFAPQDWQPVDSENRRFYEEIMGISEMLVIDHDNAN